MIHPEGPAKAGWDVFVLVVTVLGALIMPVSSVFLFGSRLIVAAAWLFPLVFAGDIAVRFNTALKAPGRLVADRGEVSRRYLGGWFWMDLLAALPLALLLPLVASPAGVAFRLLRLNALLKLPGSARTLRRIGGTRINPAILRLFLLVFWILMAAHLVSCGWILISGNPETLAPPARYVRAFYWTVTTLTTIGYGDITPQGTLQTLFVVLVELLGAGMYGLVIGNIANLIANIDVAKTQYKEKLDKINTFMKYRSLPQGLQKKINDYYGYLWETRRGYDESSVLRDLPVPLKVQVSLYLSKEIIEKVPIFSSASDDLIRDIIINLTPVVFTPGDHIVRGGEVGFDMYFISRGAVDVMSADETITYATLTAGQFFGEMALLLSTPRTATVKAKEYCDLYRLDKETFDRVITRYPEFAATIQELADRRRAQLEARVKRDRQKDED